MPKGRKNGYTCQVCKKTIVTLDVDEGTTPFMLMCRATDGCDGIMLSGFYTIPQTLPHQYEWFKPVSDTGYSPEMVEHLRKGGLDLRKVGETKSEIDPH